MSSQIASPPRLPHAYPFLFVDRVVRGPEDAYAVLRLTAGGRVCSQKGAKASILPATLPATLLLEAMAQATLALMTTALEATAANESAGDGSGAGEPARGLLVGLDEATFDESLIHRPPRPGDELVSRCEERGRFGRMVKVAAWMERDGVRVATAEMLLASG